MEQHPLRRLEPEAEIRYLKELMGDAPPIAYLDRIIQSFHVLQARSAMLLSLVTLCLTISGFSGHRIAASGIVPGICLALGLCLSVASGFLLLAGPLRIRWVTQRRCGNSLDDTLLALLVQRNLRTRRYHQAAGTLVAGLSAYVVSLILFILHTAPV